MSEMAVKVTNEQSGETMYLQIDEAAGLRGGVRKTFDIDIVHQEMTDPWAKPGYKWTLELVEMDWDNIESEKDVNDTRRDEPDKDKDQIVRDALGLGPVGEVGSRWPYYPHRQRMKDIIAAMMNKHEVLWKRQDALRDALDDILIDQIMRWRILSRIEWAYFRGGHLHAKPSDAVTDLVDQWRPFDHDRMVLVMDEKTENKPLGTITLEYDNGVVTLRFNDPSIIPKFIRENGLKVDIGSLKKKSEELAEELAALSITLTDLEEASSGE